MTGGRLRIRVVAPAGPVVPERLEAGLARLRGLGHEVVEGISLRRVHGHLAGRDEERAVDVMDALLDPSAHLVWAARGGFGGLRLVSLLDWERLAQVEADQRPALVGYSDATSLQNALVGRLDWPCWHAPMVATELDQEQDELTEASLAGMLASVSPSGARELCALLEADGQWRLCSQQDVRKCAATVILQVPGLEQRLGLPDTAVWRRGHACASSVGGNLSVLTSLFGGPAPLAFAGRTLWLEDHGEYPFRLDRHLSQLRNSGALAACSALLLGSFLNCGEPDPLKSTFSAEELLREAASEVAGPVLAGLPFGHTAPRLCLPLHGQCTVSTS